MVDSRCSRWLNIRQVARMILPQLLWRFLRHRDDPVFYSMQADDSIRWLEANQVRPCQGSRALDVGCGHGIFGGALRKKGWTVTFADESNQLLPELRSEEHRTFDLDADRFDRLGQYDLVICSNVFEHLSQPNRFLREAHELLTPDGRLYLSWTNWLSPWGGHEFAPFHYLGTQLGPAVYDRISRRPRFHFPGKNLFPTHIGRTLRQIREFSQLSLVAGAPRYYTEFAPLIRVPVAREFLAWNCALLLKRRIPR